MHSPEELYIGSLFVVFTALDSTPHDVPATDFFGTFIVAVGFELRDLHVLLDSFPSSVNAKIRVISSRNGTYIGQRSSTRAYIFVSVQPTT